MSEKKMKSVTYLLYITTQLAALFWVTLSYLMALYSTVVLGEALPIEDLSEQAIESILVVVVAKTVANIFEHNDSAVLGVSDKTKETTKKRDC